MKVSIEENERAIVLTGEQMGHTLPGFYRCVAREAGHEETEDTMCDCTRILVAPDVQDAIIQAYQERWSGYADGCHYYKACNERSNLHCGEVVIQEGFISMRNDG